MHEFLQSGELKAQAKSLLGYRFLLVLVILMNTVMVLRIPAAPPGQAVTPTTVLELQRRSPPVATLPQPAADAPDTRFVRSSPSVLPPVASQHRDNVETDQPATVNFVAMLPEAAVAAWRSKLAQAVAAEARRQLTQDFSWRPWTHPLVTDWLQAAQELEHEGTEHSKPAEVAHLPENVSAATPLETASASPPTHGDHTQVAPAPHTTDGHSSSATLDTPDTGLLVRNPKENNGAIRFLIDRRVMELQPGEAHQFSSADEWVIQFHPGGDFENVQRSLSRGTYEFCVTSHGWDLTAVGP